MIRDREKCRRFYNILAILFLEHGYHATSISKMANALGMSKSSVFSYSEDKLGLFENTLRYVLDRDGPSIDNLGLFLQGVLIARELSDYGRVLLRQYFDNCPAKDIEKTVGVYLMEKMENE